MSISVEEAAELQARALAGDKEAHRRLGEEVVFLFVRKGICRMRRGADRERVDEAIQDAMVKLQDGGVRCYDPSREVRWTTYSGNLAGREIAKSLRCYFEDAEPTVQYDPGCRDMEGVAREDTFDLVVLGEVRERVRRAVADLPEKECVAVTLRHGLDGHDPMRFREIGLHFGVSRERARQIYSRGVHRLMGNRRLREMAEDVL